MPTGRPMTLKCPHCRRGQHGQPEPDLGVMVLAEVRKRKVYGGGRRGGRVTFQQAVLCRDCQHSWWTTHFDSDLKLRELLERDKQLRLPSTGAAEPIAL